MTFRIGVMLLLASSFSLTQTVRPTAAQVIQRIKDNVGVPWFEPTIDTFKAGEPTDTVHGIAVTMMATLDVLQRAASNGDNLIITHEPIFYSHEDRTGQLEASDDPVYRTKAKFIRDHHLIVWRFHDHWHARKPDGITAGMVHALGWETYQDGNDPSIFHLPATTLTTLALALKQKLGVHAMRVIGDPAAAVSTVCLSEGFPGFERNRSLFQSKGVEVLVMGEAHEWETIAYAVDAVKEGNKKGTIILGHIPSEQAGMEECTRWLKTFIHEVPVEFVPTMEPFWMVE